MSQCILKFQVRAVADRLGLEFIARHMESVLCLSLAVSSVSDSSEIESGSEATENVFMCALMFSTVFWPYCERVIARSNKYRRQRKMIFRRVIKQM